MSNPETKALLLAVMADHIGQKNGITAVDLVAKFNVRSATRINARELRSLVEALREDGQHICATPSHGYFIAKSVEELDATCEFLRSRALRSLKQIAAMKRISMPDLFGQLHLPT